MYVMCMYMHIHSMERITMHTEHSQAREGAREITRESARERMRERLRAREVEWREAC